MLGFTADATESVVAFAFGAIELTKVTAGSLLLLTVPMDCGEHMCSPTEDLFDPSSSRLTLGAYVMNFATLICALVHYIILFQRERLMIQLLEEDRNVANNRLHDVLMDYPDINIRLLRIHIIAFRSSVVFLLCTLINIFLSGTIVFGCEWRCTYIAVL